MTLATAVGCGKAAEPTASQAVATGAAATPIAAVPAPPTVDDGIHFELQPRRIGDVRIEDRSMTSNFVVVTPAGPQKVERAESSKRRSETLAVDGEGISKVKVTFSNLVQRQNTTNAPQPLNDKTFIVWHDAGTLMATDGAGAPASAKELAALDNEELLDGKSRVMAKIVTSRAWTLGERYQFAADQLTAMNANGKKGAPSATLQALTLTAVDDQVATFTIETTLAVGADPANPTLSMAMTGELRLDRARVMPLTMKMNGPMTGVTMGAKLDGTIAMQATYTYDK